MNTPLPVPFVLLFAGGLLVGLLMAAVLWRLKRAEYQRLHAQKLQADELICQERLSLRDEKNSELVSRLAEVETERDLWRQKHDDAVAQGYDSRELVARLKTRLLGIEHQQKQQNEFSERSFLELTNAFKAISGDILKNNSRSFLDQAKETLVAVQQQNKSELEKHSLSLQEMFKPVSDSLQKVDNQIRQVEKERLEAYVGLTEQIKSLSTTHLRLQADTVSLSRALRTPTVRGRWGEIQLRRVVELAGMVEYCDFTDQPSVSVENGTLRPDMVINLPGKKTVVVDSKAVFHAYLEAMEADDEQVRNEKLQLHAKQVKGHVSQLAAKSYWQQFAESPEFVVLFLPGENFFSAALQQDPQLIEFGADKKIIIATPTTLIALLRTVSYGWRQERVAGNTRKIAELGKELYDRLLVMNGHFVSLKKGLEQTVQSFNRVVGSYEGRVMVSAKKFMELETMPQPSKKHDLPGTVEVFPRTPELGSKGDDVGDQ